MLALIIAFIPLLMSLLLILLRPGPPAVRVTWRRCWRCRLACTTPLACSWRPTVAPDTSPAAPTPVQGRAPPTPPPPPPPPAAPGPAPPTPRLMARPAAPAAPLPLVRVALRREATWRVIVPSYTKPWPPSRLYSTLYITYASPLSLAWVTLYIITLSRLNSTFYIADASPLLLALVTLYIFTPGRHISYFYTQYITSIISFSYSIYHYSWQTY